MRWKKGSEYIELERATDVARDEEVLIVQWGSTAHVQPPEFKNQVSFTNVQGCIDLRTSVESWAVKHGFSPA